MKLNMRFLVSVSLIAVSLLNFLYVAGSRGPRIKRVYDSGTEKNSGYSYFYAPYGDTEIYNTYCALAEYDLWTYSEKIELKKGQVVLLPVGIYLPGGWAHYALIISSVSDPSKDEYNSRFGEIFKNNYKSKIDPVIYIKSVDGLLIPNPYSPEISSKLRALADEAGIKNPVTVPQELQKLQNKILQ